MKEILIKSMKYPENEDIEKDIEWFCESLGILGERDKNKTAVKIFKILVNETRNRGFTTVEKISRSADISRTAAVHHIERLKNAGIVIKEGNRLELRSHSLQRMVDEIELDIERILKSIRDIAEEIDSELNLPARRKRQAQY